MTPDRPGAARRSLKARALQWLAQREHSRSELRRKLLRHARAGAADVPDPADAADAAGAAGAAADTAGPCAAPACVDALLDWLEAQRYLSQERFVEARVHARVARYGNLRISQELARHELNLPPATAQDLKDSEFERARAVWARKFDAPAATPAERARQARFLTGRGFSAEVVRRVLRFHAGRASEADDDPVAG
jgi:regulatory protein